MSAEPLFVLAAGALALSAAALLLFALRRPARADASRAQLNAALLGQRLAELSEEHARGLLGDAELAAAREDLQRRVLGEAGETDPSAAPASARRRRRLPVLLAAAAVPVVAVPIYFIAGSPHLIAPVEAASPAAATTPATDAAGQAAAGAMAAARTGAPSPLAQLEAHVAAQPRDARAWVMLARARMEAAQFAPAAVAYARAIDVAAKVGKDPIIWCEYADAVGMSQGGTLAGKPRELIDRALALNADSPCALEMAGSAAIEARDFRGALVHWKRLLTLLPEGGVQHLQLSNAVERVEQQARYALPAAAR